MRVAVFGPTYPIRGGISHFTTLLVRNLRKKNQVLFVSHRKQYPRFLYPGKTQHDDSADYILADNDPVTVFANPISWWRAARMAVGFGPRLVVFSWVSTALALQQRYISGYIKKRLPGTAVVFVCHNIRPHEKRPFDVTLTRMGLGRGDFFVVHGEDMRRDLEEIEPSARAVVTDLPSFDFFSENPVPRAEARRLLGLGAGDPVVLHFGFVRPYKGLIHLVRAMPSALERLSDLKLMVVGEFWEDVGGYRDEISRLGLEENVILVDGYVPNEEVARYFGAADLVAVPYVSSSASGIVQTAYCFSRPVIATDVGTLPEVVEDGETGYIVPPADSRALSDAIVRFFVEGRSGEFERNVEAYRSRFSWDRFTGVVEDLAGPRKD